MREHPSERLLGSFGEAGCLRIAYEHTMISVLFMLTTFSMLFILFWLSWLSFFSLSILDFIDNIHYIIATVTSDKVLLSEVYHVQEHCQEPDQAVSKDYR